MLRIAMMWSGFDGAIPISSCCLNFPAYTSMQKRQIVSLKFVAANNLQTTREVTTSKSMRKKDSAAFRPAAISQFKSG